MQNLHHYDESHTPDSVDPTMTLLRLLFWFVYGVGTLILLVTWLLLMVPGPIGKGDLILRSSAAALLLIAIVLAGWLWKLRNPFPLSAPRRLLRGFVLIVWIELIIALVEASGTALFVASKR